MAWQTVRLVAPGGDPNTAGLVHNQTPNTDDVAANRAARVSRL